MGKICATCLILTHKEGCIYVKAWSTIYYVHALYVDNNIIVHLSPLQYQCNVFCLIDDHWTVCTL